MVYINHTSLYISIHIYIHQNGEYHGIPWNSMEYQMEYQMGNTIEYPGLTGEIKVVEWAMGRFLGFQALDNSTYPSFCIPVQWGLRSEFPGCQMALSEHSLPIPNGSFLQDPHSMAISISFMVYHVPWYLMYLVLPNPWSSSMFRPNKLSINPGARCCFQAHDEARIHVKHLHNRPAKVPLMAHKGFNYRSKGMIFLLETTSTRQDYLIQDYVHFHMFKICSSHSDTIVNLVNYNWYYHWWYQWYINVVNQL